MRIVVFHALFGGWGWECIDDRGELVAESPYAFDSPEDCVEDARKDVRVKRAAERNLVVAKPELEHAA